MSKPNLLKGKILILGNKATHKKTSIVYSDPYSEEIFEDKITDAMISSFEHLKLTSQEKQKLTRGHRRMLNYFRFLNPFLVNSEAKKLIEEINHSNLDHIQVEAHMYGAYICLAALYSGKLSAEKKIDFYIEKAPLALFPKALIKKEPSYKHHKVTLRISKNCWLSPFESLYVNHKIKFAIDREELKKVA